MILDNTIFVFYQDELGSWTGTKTGRVCLAFLGFLMVCMRGWGWAVWGG